MMHWTLKVAAVVAVATSLIVHADELVTRPNYPPDPASELEQKPGTLTAADEKTCRDLFKQISNEDFDTRDQALNHLIAKGLAVLPLANEYAKDPDAEVAAAAKSLYVRVICGFDGYLPTNLALKKALLRKVSVTLPLTAESLTQTASENGVTLIFAPNVKLAMQAMQQQKLTLRLGELFTFIAAMSGCLGMPRGDVFLIADAETGERLSRKRHRFEWSALQLSRDTATDLVASLQPFFPTESTEMHAGGEMLVMQGVDTSIPRMARVIAQLTPGAPEAAWPAPDPAPASAKALEDELSTPITISIPSDSPLVAFDQFAAKGFPIALVANADPEGEPIDVKLLKAYSLESREDPLLREFQDMTDIRLKLRDIPLGLSLRWIERRSKFLNDNQVPRMLGYEIGPGGRIQFRVQAKPRLELENAIGGADVSFLCPAESKNAWTSDKITCDTIRNVLEPHLQLFPSFAMQRGLQVIHGRLIISAPWATAQRAVELIREWRDSGKPPAAPAWFENSEKRLASTIDWDGRGMSGGKVLAKLTDLSGMTILMEDAPDGHAPNFQLTNRDAALLAPGKHTVRELLDDLASKVNADWSVQLGAIVLTPKPEATAEKKGDGF
jgi:hypothetical protein